MFKKKIVLCIMLALVLCAQTVYIHAEETTIQGTVESVAEDGSYVVVNGEQIMISDEIKDYMDMETGDMVEIIVNETDQGKVAVDYNYI